MEELTVLVPYILRGLRSPKVTAAALSFGLFFGAILAILRVYGGSSKLLTLYTSILRALPHILLLLVIYFLIARVVNLSPFWAGSLSLGIISSAYQAEIIRGAILAVPGGQMMAARSIGMPRFKAIWHVILPQAFRHAIPPWSNEAAIVIKDSSLVYVLAFPRSCGRRSITAREYQPFLAYLTVVIIFSIDLHHQSRPGRIEKRSDTRLLTIR